MLWLLLVALDLLSQGQSAFQAGDFVRAESLFRQHLQTHPQSAEAMSNLAAIHSRRGEFPQAVSLYQKALKANAKLTQIHFNLGVAQLRATQYMDAIASLRAFLKSYPNDPRARELLGICLVETGAFKEAIGQLESIRKSASQPSTAFSLAYAYTRAGDADQARVLLASLEAHPAQARLVEGLIEFRRERYGEAKLLFEQALQSEPNSAPAHAALGRLFLFQNQDALAIPHLEKAVRFAPHDSESCYQLGVLYDRNNRQNEAKQLFERSLQLRPSNPGPLYALAKIDLRENRPAEAARRLEQAVRYAPEADAIHLLLGRAYQASGQAAQAKAAFAEVRRLQQSRLQKQQQDLDSQLVLDPP
ncbi:MAG: tetratricopeptide repeat protein [Acidobacteriia bacterium]|nr:tetratricopeptide repeat protein [Terriglobia bacterium]